MVSSVTPVHDNVLASVEHQDQQRGTILAVPRLLHLVVLRPAAHFIDLER